MANASNRLPNPRRTLVDSAIKFAVDQSCKATAKHVFRERTSSANANDVKIVLKHMCDMVSLTTDLLKSTSGKDFKASDVGLYMIS